MRLRRSPPRFGIKCLRPFIPKSPPRGKFSNYEGGSLIDIIPDLPNEEWRPIAGYNGKYLVSNMGRVKSLKRSTARLLTAFQNNKGYYRVCLCRDGKGRHFLVSRLVAAAFCPNDDPESKTTIDHINGDKTNNAASNL